MIDTSKFNNLAVLTHYINTFSIIPLTNINKLVPVKHSYKIIYVVFKAVLATYIIKPQLPMHYLVPVAHSYKIIYVVFKAVLATYIIKPQLPTHYR